MGKDWAWAETQHKCLAVLEENVIKGGGEKKGKNNMKRGEEWGRPPSYWCSE